MSHACPECDRQCDCWDGDELGLEYCAHNTTPACEIRDDLRDDVCDPEDWWDDGWEDE